MTSYGPLGLTAHARLDLAIALSGFAAPWVLGFAENRAATHYTLAAALAALVLDLITDYPMGLARVLPFKLHQFVEWLVPVPLIFLPWTLFADAGLMPWYLSAVGCVLLLNSALTRERPGPQPEPVQEAGRGGGEESRRRIGPPASSRV